MLERQKEEAIRTIASRWRDELAPGDKHWCDLPAVLERSLPERFPDFSLEVVPDEELPKCEAITIYSPHIKTIRMRESVYTGLLDGEPRCRFTAAHELGHFLLDETHLRVPFRPGTAWDPERQANIFASEFLCPTRLAKGMSMVRIKWAFGLSFEAAMRRYEELNWPLVPEWPKGLTVFFGAPKEASL